MRGPESIVVATALLVALSAVGGAASAVQTAETDVEVTASPTDWDEAQATHAVVFTVGPDAESAGGQFDSLVVDYEPGAEPADVSNVGPEAVQWVGVDRDGDDVGTRVDETATIAEVSDRKDGQALRIETAGDLQLSAGDEVVAVYRGVQNPQDQGTTVESAVDVTLNDDGASDVDTGAVTYEYNDANVTISDQETTGESVTVDSVALSEPGFAVVLNESGRNPDAVRGATYLEAGSHEDVHVDLDPAVADDEALHVQIHLDTDGDQRFNYSGGPVDRPFEDRDGNVLATDSAQITYVESGGTSTPSESTETATATSTPTGTDSDSSTDDGTTDEEEDDETETSTDDDGGMDGTATEDATDDATGGTTGMGSPTQTDGDGAGFGAATALLAVLGAARLFQKRD